MKPRCSTVVRVRTPPDRQAGRIPLFVQQNNHSELHNGDAMHLIVHLCEPVPTLFYLCPVCIDLKDGK